MPINSCYTVGYHGLEQGQKLMLFNTCGAYKVQRKVLDLYGQQKASVMKAY